MAELALGIAGLAIGVPGLIQAIGSLGDAILQNVRHYDDNYYQKRLELVIRINKSQTQEIFQYMDSEDQKIPEALKDEVIHMFQAIRDTFERLITIFPGAGSEIQPGKRIKISASMKAKVDAEVRAIEEWNTRILNRTLVFVLFSGKKAPVPASTDSASEFEALASRKVERLRDSVHQSLEKAKEESHLLLSRLENHSHRPLSNSSLELATPNNKGDKGFIIEYRTYNDNAPEREIKHQRTVVREVARILRRADSQFMGLLYCEGFVWDSLKNRFELHFPLPTDLRNPRTLLDLLSDPSNQKSGVRHPLNHRISLAKSIVTAVFVLHAAGFVHKQIRPDNVLIFEEDAALPTSTDNASEGEAKLDKQRYPYVLGKPFLVGFDNVRKADAASLLLPIEDWKKNIYLSPERQRLQRGDEFQMHHDIYSLGVVLLEIAFWATFQDKKSAQLGRRVWKDASQSVLRGPEELKKVHMALATGAVPRLMGQKYADAVVACLTGLESGEGGAPNLEDEDGIVIGTRYVTEIIKKLEEISM